MRHPPPHSQTTMPSREKTGQKSATILSLAIAMVTIAAENCGAQDNWLVQATQSMNLLSDVAFGSGVYVTCGDGGTILTSPDGSTWTPQDSGTQMALRSIVFGNGRFVAVGEDGISTTSTDGTSWTASTTDIDVFASGVTFTGSEFVAVGSGGNFSRSADGISWRSRKTPSDDQLLAKRLLRSRRVDRYRTERAHRPFGGRWRFVAAHPFGDHALPPGRCLRPWHLPHRWSGGKIACFRRSRAQLAIDSPWGHL